jgi:HSP20 family protein
MRLITTNPRRDVYASPLTTLFALEREFDRMLGRGTNEPGENVDFAPALDVAEDANQVTVSVELPGVAKDNVQVKFHDGYLTIAGERKSDTATKEGGYHRRERSFGRFERSVYLNTAVDSNNVRAAYKDGVLTVTLPKSAEAKPREIPVATN